ncbi:MAG TPA: polysaccharide biosynthesis C-terminal domain-containing protein, partial [Flavisolibacter sp.]|nr:polysaccharide biosynthesis C-terminal domain-containing protein [Flavisolibacter sp.]
MILGYVLRNVVYQVFKNSPELPQYYYWIFPFGFGFTVFLILEAFAIQQRKSVLSNFLKEVLFRFLQTILIVFTFWGVIGAFDSFIKIYSFTYLALAIILLGYFIYSRQIGFHLAPSIVTKRFLTKIATLASFVWGGSLVYNVAAVFDTIVLAAVLPNGMVIAGIFTLAQNIASLIQAPQRAVVSASLGPLSQAWKEKDYKKINTIYQRSSINLLLFSTAMFCLIWMNFDYGVATFGLKPVYLEAKYAFLFIGLTRVIDLGTGVNAQIIGTSTFWRFEFGTGLLLLALTLPMNYFLTRQLGLVGPAVSNLIAFTIYNAIRYFFLWKKLGMQPFNLKSLQTLLMVLGLFAVCYYSFHGLKGLTGIIIRSSIFSALFIAGTIALKLSPDIEPLWQTTKKRLRL